MRKSILFAALMLISLTALSQKDKVVFSSPGGFYEESFLLTLSCKQAGHHIRYTINGNTPTTDDLLYQQPLSLDERLYSSSDIYTIQISPDDLVFIPDSIQHAIVIRAAAFDHSGNRVSDITTNTYLIKELGCESHGLAVVSICADSLMLFDYDTGILVPGVHWDPNEPNHTGNYYLHGQEWERLVNMEFYEPDDNSGVNQVCGLRTHGNRSRRYPSKGMKVYAREEYGNKRFEHAFFSDTHLTSFKRLVLKPFASFWPYSGVQDYFCNKLAIAMGLTAPDSRPVIVYLNGEYWGIYFIQEKMDERYLEDYFDVDGDDCNIISSWTGEIEQGNNKAFKQMMNWFKNADLTCNGKYRHARDLIDMDNFIDYNVFETFIGNWDWPGNNMRCWQEGNGQWRWIFFDGDATIMMLNDAFDVFTNAAIYLEPATWNNFPNSKLLLGKLLENNQFKTAFKQRAQYLCDGLFRRENTLPILDSIMATLRPHIDNQKHRFGYPLSLSSWENENQYIYDFLNNRVEDYLKAINDFPLFQMDVAQDDLHKFICFPNPTDGVINLQMVDTLFNTVDICIYDISGQLVFKEKRPVSTNEPIQINMDYKAGVYFIKIGSCVERVIKK